MNQIIKCVWCRGKSKKGIHDICWKELKGFMLSDLIHPTNVGVNRDEAYDEYTPTGMSYKDPAGRSVVQGHVLPPKKDYDE